MRHLIYNRRMICLVLLVFLSLLSQHVLSKSICRQEQLGATVLIKCPPEDKFLLSHCCNDNGKIVCCSEEDFIHREAGQSVEAVTLLAIAGFITVLIVTILCYVRWHSRFLKSDPSESSHTAKNSELVTAQQNEHQGTLSPQATVQRTIPSCRYAKVLESILNEDKEEISFHQKNARK